MCGIAGIYGNVDKETLKRMTKSISHRGPDGEGFFIDKKVGLGHRRLSIIDLKKGTQPMFDKDKRFVIVFNGEIYNFISIKEDLKKKGITFNTNSDTEVILYLYKLYGKSCLEFLNGMFSFAIYDIKDNSLFLARDRLGVKPLYYYKDDGLFVFASEIKSILEHPSVPKEINKNALYEFLFRQYISAPDTIFKQVYKLEAGHYIFIKDKTFIKENYWTLNYSEKVTDESVVIKNVRNLLEESVKRRLIADVPLGAFLSGGIDSSIIVSLMHKHKGDGIKTFSVGFNEKGYDETKYARIISDKFNTDHNEIILDSSYMKILDRVIYHLDEPLADFASLPTYLLSELARKKVKVVLTGEGGDENYGGYDYYTTFHNINKIFPFVFKKSFLYNKKVFAHNQINSYLNHIKFEGCRDNLRQKLIFNYFGKGNFFNQMLNWDTRIWLPDDLLMKVDKTSMAHGLEARTPFLDYTHMEYIASINTKYKHKKYILKKAFSADLPKEILNRKKHGFDVPVSLWFNGDYKGKVDSTVENNKILLNEYFNYPSIEKMIKEKRDNLFLWRLYNFIVWSNKFMK